MNKDFLSKIDNSLNSFEKYFSEVIGKKMVEHFQKHPEVYSILLLGILCFLFLFYGLDFYPLLDVDETRYAVMSRDLLHSFNWNNLMLNYEPFLEKPPLYFWLVAASIKAFGEFTEFAVRFPIALCATFTVFFTYFVGKIAISRKFGLFSALILLSSVFFLILSHVAIIDMVLTVCIASALYCGFSSHFVQDRYKKYCWWYFYVFVGAGFLAKGVLAFALPVLVMFLYNWATKTLKDFFKPVNFIVGLLIFLIIIAPWHMIMYFEYKGQFIREYFLMHHFARFIDSSQIGRQRPFLYFLPVFFLGFLPWSIAFIAFLIDGCKKLTAKVKLIQGGFMDKLKGMFAVENNEQKLILFASIYFLVIFGVVSISSTKLPTYILPAFPAAALLTGYFWWESDKKADTKAVSITTQIFAAMFLIAALSATIFYWVLPYDIQEQISEFRGTTVIGVYLLSILLLLRIKTNNAISIFSAYILTMFFVISLGITYLFNLVYAGGENELVKYSKLASFNDAQLVTFDFSVKPSTMINSNGRVHFITDPEVELLDEALQNKNLPIFVIVKNKHVERHPDQQEYLKKNLSRIESGKKYSLYANQKTSYFQESTERNRFSKKHHKNLKKTLKEVKTPREFLLEVDGFNETPVQPEEIPMD